MHRWLVLVLVLAPAACHKDKSSSQSPTPGPTAPASTAELDALWAKAPDGAMVGFVASPRAITMGEHAWQDVHAFLKKLPEFASVEQEMTGELAKAGLAPDFTFADIGIGPAKGAAIFVADGGKATFAIFPVVDRDKFLAKVKGTKGDDFDKLDKAVCKTIDGGFYACADSAELFARFGKGNLRAGLDTAKARGDLELVVTEPVKLAAVGQIARGQIIVRGSFAGVPALYASKLGAAHTPKVDVDHASGFAMLDLKALMGEVPELPIVEGVTTTDVMKSIAGPLMVTVQSGEFGIDSRLPLSDTGAAKKLIQHCGDLPPSLGAKLDGDKCRVPVPQLNIDAVGSIDGNDLHLVAKAGGGAPAKVPPTAAGAELAKGSWSMVFWGRGTILAPTPNPNAMPWTQMPAEAEVAIRALTMFDELGLGMRVDGDHMDFFLSLRTAWANPDDVVAKLSSIDPSQVVAGKGGDLGKAIADASPNSPFADDYRSGYGGLMVPTAVVGMMAAVAVPAFMSYMSHSRARGAGSLDDLNGTGDDPPPPPPEDNP